MFERLEKGCRRRFGGLIIALIVGIAASLASAAPAHAAKLKFGTEEELRFIQDVDLKTRDGEALYLGYKLSFQWLGLPYAMKDDGYVLGVKGQNRYYTIDQDLMKEWQAQGYLPASLPAYQIGTIDYVLAYLMWIVLAVVAAWYGGRALLGMRMRHAVIEGGHPAGIPEALVSTRLAGAMQPQAAARAEPPPAAEAVPRTSVEPVQGARFALPPTEIAKLPVAKTVSRVKELKPK